MINGFNLAAVSEFVHEIGRCPVEGLLHYAALTKPQLEDWTESRTEALKAGSIRVSRDFSIRLQKDASRAGPGATAVEGMLIALGGCALITFIQGLSFKKITVDHLVLTVRGDILKRNGADERTIKLANLGYSIELDSDGADEDIQAVLERVSCFSPNHRTFVEAIPISLKSPSGQTRVLDSHAATEGSEGYERIGTVQVQLVWKYGLQITITGLDRSAFPRLVDAPKQFLGLDEAPNPQEYLLSALGSELVTSSALAGLISADTCIRTRGIVDLRGLLRVNPESPVWVHDMVFELPVLLSEEKKFPEDELIRALEQSPCNRLIREPQTLEVSCVHQGRSIFHELTDRSSAAARMRKFDQPHS